jgi:hypothetical protein
MNYPNIAMPGFGANASWFYKRFSLQFDKHELLFLRHAPEHYVEMGGEAWFQNHARAASSAIDRRLQLAIRSRKQIYEAGEPIRVELRLKNVGEEPVTVHGNLDPCDGFVELAMTNPNGVRRPHVPIAHTRIYVEQRLLEPNGTPLFASVDVTVGAFGFPFKWPGAYRIDASYTNLDGSYATAALHLSVRPPRDSEAAETVNELFDARIGRVLYVGGTRVMEDVNDKLDWVRHRLGPYHPVSLYLATIRFRPLATLAKVVEPASSRISVLDGEPDRVVANLASVLVERPDTAADTLGHIGYRETVDMFTRSAVRAGARALAVQAQKQLLGMFRSRKVLPSVIASVEERAMELGAHPALRHRP